MLSVPVEGQGVIKISIVEHIRKVQIIQQNELFLHKLLYMFEHHSFNNCVMEHVLRCKVNSSVVSPANLFIISYCSLVISIVRLAIHGGKVALYGR